MLHRALPGGAKSLLIHVRFLYTSQLTVINSCSRVLAPVCHLSSRGKQQDPVTSRALLFLPPRRGAARQPGWGWPAARELQLISMLMAIIILKINTCNHNIHPRAPKRGGTH